MYITRIDAQYVKGNIVDCHSPFKAASIVEKVVCTVDIADAASAEEVEFRVVAPFIQTFPGAGIPYGSQADATSRVLFNVGTDRDFSRRKRVVPTMGAEGAPMPWCNL